MTIYGFRVILDYNQADIFRDIEISSEATFEDFHNSIVQAFALDSGEMAHFTKVMSSGLKVRKSVCLRWTKKPF